MVLIVIRANMISKIHCLHSKSIQLEPQIGDFVFNSCRLNTYICVTKIIKVNKTTNSQDKNNEKVWAIKINLNRRTGRESESKINENYAYSTGIKFNYLTQVNISIRVAEMMEKFSRLITLFIN